MSFADVEGDKIAQPGAAAKCLCSLRVTNHDGGNS